MAKRRLPPLKALPAFEQAASHLSFSAAARELNLTHGAISRQMKSLETHLGVRLFRRLNRRLELTDAGAAFLPAARTALDVVEASAARLSAGTRAGPLVVSCLPTFMMRWLIPRLYDFNARHPAIDVRLSASSAAVDFAREGVDVAIRMGAPPWPDGIEAHPFMNEEIGPVCSPALAERSQAAPTRRPATSHAAPYRDARRCLDGLAGAQQDGDHRCVEGPAFRAFLFPARGGRRGSRRGRGAAAAGDGGPEARPPGRPVRLRAQRPAILPALSGRTRRPAPRSAPSARGSTRPAAADVLERGPPGPLMFKRACECA